jgi:hypothetical protein
MGRMEAGMNDFSQESAKGGAQLHYITFAAH